MCGIAGWLGREEVRDAPQVAKAMTDSIRHRGPDDSGVWIDKSAGVALAHRRLSIIDVSSEGHQPMVSKSGRYVVAFNGEIYNFREIRRSLETQGCKFRGHSDTEVMLAAIEEKGFEIAIREFSGMFAIALWDREKQELVLARDRFGEKPLYYGWQGSTFLFGSELKSLKKHPNFVGAIDRGALSLLLRFNCIPAPFSIYTEISKVRPGHIVRVSGGKGVGQSVEEMPYWSLNSVVADGLDNQFDLSPEEACSALERELMASVKRQMVSDVPIGAFLSGGIDSSTVVSLMQAQSDRPVKTFTIGTNVEDYDEARQAAAVANHLGTEHTELYVTPEDALAVIPDLPNLYCEPFSDSSQIPTYLVSKLASEHVKVALSGDAADELFAGYNRHLVAGTLWKRARKSPRALRMLAAKMLTSLSPTAWDAIAAKVRALSPRRSHLRMVGDKAHKLASVLTAGDGAEFYKQLVSHWPHPDRVVLGAKEPSSLINSENDWPRTDNLVHWMMAIDAQTYLSDDILVKVDRAAMANSLETRVPFLDHQLVEFAWRLPLNLKIKNGQTKWLLRQVLYKYVPQKLVDRPKMGFGIPLQEWLRGPLRDWAEELLNESRLRREGFFDPAPIRSAWNAHLSGKTNEQYRLWDVLMFQAWLSAQK